MFSEPYLFKSSKAFDFSHEGQARTDINVNKPLKELLYTDLPLVYFTILKH